MERGLFACIRDRAVANARVLRGAPEAVALVGVITIGVSYFAFDETGLLFAALRPVCASANKVVSFSI